MIRQLALALVLFASSFSIASATPGGTQNVTCSALVAAVTANLFTWASGAQTCTAPSVLISHATFVAWISNNGSCVGSATYLMTFGQMTACETGGGSVQTSESASFEGNSTHYSESSGCTTSTGVTQYSTSSAVAPTTSATQISWQSVGGSNSAFTLEFVNSGGTTVASYSVPASSSATYSYYNSGAAAGVYTVVAVSLPNSVCPATGPGGSANGTLFWYVP